MRTTPHAHPASGSLGAHIAVLLHDPRVAERVRRRLDQAAESAAADLAGTPPCFRAADAHPPSPVLVKSGRCRAMCGSIDCLCGSYPRQLTDREVTHGRRLSLLAS
jgi:hypothetical protein